ncbi:unnamed protein product [Schistocephalus solidus]|uniref:Notch n=1 Tax=Schistocephalus solidus TaxID=70667 RepID=A0A183SXJ5_SCHSO|nr:unnamed protein product [Schistocephalus solidus]
MPGLVDLDDVMDALSTPARLCDPVSRFRATSAATATATANVSPQLQLLLQLLFPSFSAFCSIFFIPLHFYLFLSFCLRPFPSSPYPSSSSSSSWTYSSSSSSSSPSPDLLVIVFLLSSSFPIFIKSLPVPVLLPLVLFLLVLLLPRSPLPLLVLILLPLLLFLLLILLFLLLVLLPLLLLLLNLLILALLLFLLLVLLFLLLLIDMNVRQANDLIAIPEEGRKCEHRDPCLDAPCENGGQCQSSPLGDYQCFCPRWYEGTHCEIAKQPCKRNSTCREGTDHCEVLYETFEAPSPRPGTALLTGSRISGFRCVCKPGFEGVLCEREMDHCHNNRCQNGAQCVNFLDRYRCECAPGFTGDYCQNILTSVPNSRSNDQLTISDSEMSQFCESIGCSRANMTGGTCNGRCVLASCFEDQQLRNCAPWTQCLETTKSAFRVGEATCVERFRDGICDRECAIASCFHDGFDCLGSGSACPPEAHCSSVYGNGVCNSECASPGCGFDGGDCATPTYSLPPVQVSGTGTTGYIVLILDANRTAFEVVQRAFLAQQASMLRAVVRIANDEYSVPRITDLDNGRRTRVTLFIDLLPDNHTKPNGGESYLTVDDAAQSLTAALASHALIPPLPVAQLWSAKDPNEILPGQVPLGPPDKQHFFRAKDAIALYICFCTLAGGKNLCPYYMSTDTLLVVIISIKHFI